MPAQSFMTGVCALMTNVIIGTVALSSTDENNELMLDCERPSGGPKQVFVLFPEQGQARFVSTDPAVTGILTVNEHKYVLHFPSTEERYETVVNVNRYTGEMEFEAGEPPFGELNSKNIFWTGNCESGRHERRF